jgi:hypothetical protein
MAFRNCPHKDFLREAFGKTYIRLHPYMVPFAAKLMLPDLKTHVAHFQHWLKTDPGDAATWQREREERLIWYRFRPPNSFLQR